VQGRLTEAGQDWFLSGTAQAGGVFLLLGIDFNGLGIKPGTGAIIRLSMALDQSVPDDQIQLSIINPILADKNASRLDVLTQPGIISVIQPLALCSVGTAEGTLNEEIHLPISLIANIPITNIHLAISDLDDVVNYKLVESNLPESWQVSYGVASKEIFWFSAECGQAAPVDSATVMQVEFVFTILKNALAGVYPVKVDSLRILDHRGKPVNSEVQEGVITVTFTNHTPESFSLISPENGAFIGTTTPLLKWETAWDADLFDTVCYEITLEHPDKWIELIPVGTDTAYQYPENLLENQVYYWQVIARDRYGSEQNNLNNQSMFTVDAINDPPEFTATLVADTLIQGNLIEFTYQAADFNPADQLHFTLLNGPATAEIDSITGFLRWEVTADDIGIQEIIVTVTDGNATVVDTTAFVIYRWGDPSLNNSVTAFDAALILKHCVGSDYLQGFAWEVADVSGNGDITAYDASFVLQYAVGLIDHFPVESEKRK
jgi:hypothetical protein